MRSRSARPLWGGLIWVVALGGCSSTIRDTTTARAAEEMLLVSTAAERAIDAYPVTHLSGHKVWIDESFFDSIDKSYVMSCVRGHLSEAGALLVEQEQDASFVLEVRNGTLGINDPEWTIGIPAIPFAAQGIAVTLPRLAIGYDPQEAWAKFQFWTYAADTGETVDLGEAWGRAETGWFQSISPNVVGTVHATVGD